MKNSAADFYTGLQSLKTIPHAWLFTGENSNKIDFARDLAQRFLCTAASHATRPCNECKACNLFAAGTHPDFCAITTDATQHSITIDEIRAVNYFVQAKPQLAQYKIVLIYPAEKLNNNAANALLKNLEEPASNTLFFLLAKHPALLLPTIVSRVVQYHFTEQDVAQKIDSEAMLKILSDLHALWVTNNVTANDIADNWVGQWPNQVLYWFELVLADLILFKYTDSLKYLQLERRHAELNRALPASKLWDMLQQLRQAQYWLGNNGKPNLQLLLEKMLLI